MARSTKPRAQGVRRSQRPNAAGSVSAISCVREEAQIKDGQILQIAEFFHPRTQEIADTLPAGLGRLLLRTRWARGLLDRATRKGRVVKTTSMGGFLLLYTLAKLKPLRRRSLRFATEQAVLANWLNLVAATARADYPLALQIARMRSLVKGYGETHPVSYTHLTLPTN